MSLLERVSAASPSLNARVASGTPIRRVRGISEFDDIEPVWDSYSQLSDWASPMQHHLWARTYAEVYGADRRLEIIKVGTGRATAIAPLYRPKGRGRRLELIGVNELYEVIDFLYSDCSDIEALASAVAATRLPVVLHRIRRASRALSALDNAYRGNAVVFCRPVRGCPWIALDDSWLNPERHINAGRRSDLRRARRNAEQIGPVTWEILSPKGEELSALIDEAYRIEAAGWKGRNGTALLRDSRQAEFYRRYAAAAGERGILRLCFLRIGGKAAATQIAVVTGNRFWLFKIGYSEKFARCSPGILLMLETIRYAAQSGLRSYEFLGGAEPWLRNWTSLEHPCVSFRAYPLNPRGIAALAGDGAAALVKRARSGG